MTETTTELILLVDAFELCARSNLESAANSLDRLADRSERIGARVLAASDRNAAATIRELLRLDSGAYFTTATEGK